MGVLEAPRGTLIHHYRVDEQDMVVRANLIVSTTHNNEAMNPQCARWRVATSTGGSSPRAC